MFSPSVAIEAASRLRTGPSGSASQASVAAGPVGRATTAETDVAAKAEILSYSRSRGAFAGIALKGTTLRQDNDANKALYGKAMDAQDILSASTAPPAGATPMLNALKMYSPIGK